MVYNRATSSLDLTRRDPRRFQRLESELTEREDGAAQGLTPPIPTVYLTMFGSLRLQHGLDIDLLSLSLFYSRLADLGQNIAFVDPYFHAYRTEGGMRLRDGKIDISP